MRKQMPLNIPNLLTVLRYLLVPVFIWSYFAFPGEEGGHPIAAGVLLFSGITDVLDGIIARKFNMMTEWGKTHDPLADKVTQIAAISVIWYTLPRFWPLYSFLIIKEAAIIIGGLRLYKRNSQVSAAKWFGKLSTVVFYAAVLIIIYNGRLSELAVQILLIIIAAFMIFSGIKYALVYKANLKQNSIAIK